MKKLKLGKLLLGSLTEAQQRNVLGGSDEYGEDSGASTFKIQTMCVTPPPPITSVDVPCTPPPPPVVKTTNTTPCA